MSENDTQSNLPLAEEKLYEHCQTGLLGNIVNYINKDNNIQEHHSSTQAQSSDASKALHQIIQGLP